MSSNLSNIYQSNIAIFNASQNTTPLLLHHINENAAYDSKSRANKDSCYEGTRTQHIHDITVWATSTTPPQKRLLWMHGPAGVGKTTIAQSCAEIADKSGALGASFFFTRDNGVVDSSQFFTTLAYQISRKIRQYKDLLGTAICDDPTLLTKGLETQMKALIVDPFLQLAREHVEIDTSVVFIDGLDECQDSRAQVKIVELISESVRAHGHQIPLLWAIFSRPEAHVISTFTATSIRPLCWTVELPVSRDLDTEIRIYLEGALSRRPNGVLDFILNTCSWPSDRDLDTLVEVSAGLFIYAATLARFITDPDCDPEEQLRDVLLFHSSRKGHPVNPLAELDALYRMILARIPLKIRDIIQHVLLLHHQNTNWDMEDLANLSERSIITLENSFSRLYSVLTFKRDGAKTHCCKWGSVKILLHHASFIVFLMDPWRSSEFCIDDRRHWTSLLSGCLPLLHVIQTTNGKGSRDEKLQKLEQSFSAVPDGSCVCYQKHMFALRNWLYEPIRDNLLRWRQFAGFEEGESVAKAFSDINFEMLWTIGPQIKTGAKLLEKFPEDLRIHEPHAPHIPDSILPTVECVIRDEDLINIDVLWPYLIITFNATMSALGTLSSEDHDRCVYWLREFERNAESESIVQLSLRLEDYFSAHVKTLVATKGAEYAKLDERQLLYHYIEQWSLYEGVIGLLQFTFSGTSAWNDSVEKLHSVPKMALSHWMLGFFRIVQGIDHRLTCAVIRLATHQRAGDLVEVSLIRRFILSLTTLAFDHDSNVWHYDINNFREAFLQATDKYYSAERISFLAHNSLQSYLAFAMDRLSEELVIHSKSFFCGYGLGRERWQEREETAITCRDALVGDRWESIYTEFEAQLALGDQRRLEHIYYLANVDRFRYPTLHVKDGHIDRLEGIFMSHVQKTMSDTISISSSSVSPEIKDDRLCLECYFVILDLKQRYSEMIKQAFDGDHHFFELLDDTFEELLDRHPWLRQALDEYTARRTESGDSSPVNGDDITSGPSRDGDLESFECRSAPVPASSRLATPSDNAINQVTCVDATLKLEIPFQLTMGNTYSGMNAGQIIHGQNTLNQSANKAIGSSQPSAASIVCKRPASESSEDLNVKKTKLLKAIMEDVSDTEYLLAADAGDTSDEDSDHDSVDLARSVDHDMNTSSNT